MKKQWGVGMGIEGKHTSEAEIELRRVLNWARNEEKKLIAQLKEQGKWVGGLDGNSKDFEYINKEMKRRIKEIQQKYSAN